MMTYDQWKCTDPRDCEPEEECFHEEYDIDWEGFATCERCGHGWFASPQQVEAQRKHEEEYAKWEAEQHRRERWLKLTAPFRWAWYRLWNPLSPRVAIKSLNDDEIPF